MGAPFRVFTPLNQNRNGRGAALDAATIGRAAPLGREFRIRLYG